ncbi:Bromodomain-containing protein [Cunninghamella echinulata]|nr:Bromodomain-containing protein [Cunninghamella echinulata]
MTRDQVKYCGAIMRNLKKHRDAAPFIHPVDYIQLKIPDYPTVIKHPIDLTTIDNKLQRGEYNEVADFVDDIRLLFNNCYKFNGPEAMVSMLCQNVENAFEKSLRQMPPSKEVSNIYKYASIDSPTTKEGSTSGPASFRRISEDYRPKREVHPPPSKDYPEVYQQQRRRTTTNGTSSSSPSTITGNNSNNGRRKLDVQMRFCHQALKELKKSKYRDINYPFLQPVDPVALNIPDYHTIISHPMDISTIEKNLNQGEYTSPDEFESDIKLMFNNCYRYNPPSLPVSKMAKQLEMVFDEKWKHLPEPEPTPPSPSPPPPPPPPSTSQQSHISSSSSQSSMHPSTSSKVITRKAEKYVSDDEASDNADSDSDVDDRIAELERHILTITQEIQSIKSGKKKTDRSTSKSTTKKRKPTKPSTTANKKQQQIDQPVKRRRSNKSQQQQQQQQQQQRIMDELPEFTFDQKKDLSERINNLVGDKLNTVVNIIQSSMPNLDGGQEEIVLDIDALDRKTLHRLHEFVTGTSLIRKRPPPPPTSSKQNIKKRKSDNDRRIRALEESIKKFHSRKLKGRESSSESDSDSSSSSDSDDSGSSSD